MITSNPLWRLLKPTIDGITTESLEKAQVCIGKGKIVQIENMEDGYADDIEVAGTTLLEEKAEGQTMSAEDIILGGTKRYIPKTMAKKVSISEETLEDNKYEKVLQPSKRLMASAYKTQDIDFANMLLASTTQLGGYDNVALASTSHTLVAGGTTSNYLNAGVGMTPSPQALIQMRSLATLMPGPNGLVDSLELEGIVFPEIQLDLWKVITGTEKAVGSNYNDLNTVKSYGLALHPVKWFDAVSTTFWGCITDAKDGLKFLQRRKIKGNTWVDNDGMVAHHGVSYRCSVGWSNWRHWLQGNV
jgi:hypothetical protein